MEKRGGGRKREREEEFRPSLNLLARPCSATQSGKQPEGPKSHRRGKRRREKEKTAPSRK